VSLDRLDPLLSTPKKLAAIGMLAGAKEVEFSFIRDHLELSDSDLSKQMSPLVAAGYVEVRKTGRGRQRKTWYRATRTGSAAMKAHVQALNDLIHDSVPTPPQTDDAKNATGPR
jgi:DNA-binding transcriptional ArsR family regulator